MQQKVKGGLNLNWSILICTEWTKECILMFKKTQLILIQK
jgi:hypothetical protein